MANTDKKLSFGDRAEVFCMAVFCVAVLALALLVVTWVGAMVVSSIDCEFDPASQRCELVQAQDNAAAERLGL